jgi:ribosomal protein S18 acetylase RimI-like enzyme
MRIEILSAAEMDRRLPELLELDREIPAEPWGPGAFLLELPEKFRYSRLILEGERTVGFVVASRKGSAVHVHRLVVAASARGHGHGRHLIGAVAAVASDDGLAEMTLKVAASSAAAVAFYREIGFRDAGPIVGGNRQLVADIAPLAGADGGRPHNARGVKRAADQG